MGRETNGSKMLFDMIAKIIALLLLVTYVAIIVDKYMPFINNYEILVKVISYVLIYAPLALIIATGAEFVSDKTFVTKLIFLIVAVAVAIFQFLPGTFENIVSQISQMVA